VVELPLCAVRMIRIWDPASWDAQNFHVEGMTLVEIGGVWLSTKSFGNGLAESDEFYLGRVPFFFGKIVRVNFLHGEEF
jgi:hypothetical protein